MADPSVNDWITVNPTPTANLNLQGDPGDWQTAPADEHKQPGALARFWQSFSGAVNPIPAIEQWWDRNSHLGNDHADMAAALAVGLRARGRQMTPEEQTIFDKGSKALARQDTGTSRPPVVPFGGEPAVQAGVQAQQGNLAGAAGTVAGAYGVPAVIGYGASKITGPKAPGGAPLIKSRLNPTQQGAVDYLQGEGVPLNAGTVTGNKFVKGAQALTQNQPMGAGVAATAGRATEQGLTRVSGELADQAHPFPATPESAGAAVSDQLLTKISELKIAEDEAYGDAWKGADNPAYAESVPVRTEQRAVVDEAGKPTGKTESLPVMATVQMPVDVRGIKQQLGPVWDSMQWMPASDQASSAGFQAVKKILNGPDYIPAAAAEQGLGGLKTMARVANTNLRNTSQGMAAGIIPDLQEGIDAAVSKTGPDALAALQKGRATHASKMDVADVTDKLRDEPVQAFNQLTWKQDTGIDFLRRIGDQAPNALPQIGRAYIQKLFDQATQEGGFSRAQTIAGRWEDLGPKTKALLYPNPALRSSLDKFFLGAKMVAENPNPSGTAVVGSLIPGAYMMIHNPVAGTTWLLGGYAAAKLLFSPAGVRLLTGGLKAEAPGAAAFRAAQILKMAGDEDVKQAPSGWTTAGVGLASAQKQQPEQ